MPRYISAPRWPGCGASAVRAAAMSRRASPSMWLRCLGVVVLAELAKCAKRDGSVMGHLVSNPPCLAAEPCQARILVERSGTPEQQRKVTPLSAIRILLYGATLAV